MPQISEIFLKHNKFVICSEDSMISKCAIGTYGINYYELGKITAKQAAKILKNKAKPETMPIEYMPNEKLSLNYEIINKLGIKISEKLKGEL